MKPALFLLLFAALAFLGVLAVRHETVRIETAMTVRA